MANLTYDGNVKVSFVSTISAQATPTVAELNAGTSLEAHITPDGFEVSMATAEVDQSSLASTFDTKAAGRRTPAINVTFKTLTSAGALTAAATALVYRAQGYIVVRKHKAATVAWAAADRVDVFPVEVGGVNPANAAPNEVQKATAPMFVTADPSLEAVVAA